MLVHDGGQVCIDVGAQHGRLTVTRSEAPLLHHIKEDGVEACAANPSLQTWPAAYREGTVHGLLFDRNGYVSPNPWGAKHIALIMAAHPDPAAILEDLAVKLRSAEWEYSYAVDRGLRSP